MIPQGNYYKHFTPASANVASFIKSNILNDFYKNTKLEMAVTTCFRNFTCNLLSQPVYRSKIATNCHKLQ